MLTQFFAFFLRFGGIKKRLWRRWYDYLAGYRQVTDWTCMNYGYAGTPQKHTTTVPAELESERWCLQLYHHVASAVPLEGLKVLEVGSGRGGGAAFLKQSLRPAKYMGIDFSDAAVALCGERYKVDGLEFRQGDAENLPLEAGAFDAVINVESSHCYGEFPRFVSEVTRVLKPGGHFLHADFRDSNELDRWRAALTSTGLELIRETEITPNVLAALDEDDARKQSLIRKIIPKWLLNTFRDFAGTRGSVVYRAFENREMRYFSFVLRKEQS
ncbi:MAG TPA: methyltransferase domain-containing protein [Chthoniobacter sp.]|nr:methyltransferase domain-containing protein [Chthoniobacter sp.]